MVAAARTVVGIVDINTNRELEQILDELRNMGCRITKQRLLIVKVILQEKYICCKEIYYKASSIDPNVGIATVYRLLGLLETIGVIERCPTYRLMKEKKKE